MSGAAQPSIFTIGAGAPFAESLARGLMERLGSDPAALADVTIYLPTRRAARSFGEVFARLLGGATLLPRFQTLGDADEDDLLFGADSDGIELKPAITPLRRQLLLADQIRRWHRHRGSDIDFSQAAALAATLASVMDELERQGADPEKITDLAPLDLAEHWQTVQDFLMILHRVWPGVLEAEGTVNPAVRRNAALRTLARRLEAAPPSGMVIAAGSTGSIPATAELLSVIARLPRGAVVLPGLDRMLDDESWEELDPGHPQFGLKQLLTRMEANRAAVRDWDGANANPAREKLLSQTLRPAPTTDAWRALVETPGDIAKGFEGLARTVANDPAEEALGIAIALRQALETPGRTAALVTPDRDLARRVAAELRRWDIMIDDSAGRPLSHTSAGAFLCLAAEAADAHFAPVPLLALLKHPFARCNSKMDGAAFRAMARALDRALRGPRPDPGLGGVTRALQAAPEELRHWWHGIVEILAPLEALFAKPETTLSDLLAAHLAAAEALACDANNDCILWTNTDGESAAQFSAALRLAAADLPAIAPQSYAPLFRRLAAGPSVRGAFGQHPRLAILGPLEARLLRFDLTILGGLNEGTWPRGAGADPWFSRPMRTALGLEQPERAIGLAAHDFAMLAAGPDILFTRARKTDGAPTVPSRWLQRLDQLTRGLKLEDRLAPATDPVRLAAQLMTVPPPPRLKRPAPAPPLEARPRALSVTEIEVWLRDPYAIYAKHVLKLRPLDPLDQQVGPLEKGNALHRALELFLARYPKDLPDNAVPVLAGIADDVFAEMAIPKAALALWRPRFLSAARWFVDFERERRTGITNSWLEKKGSLVIAGPQRNFELRARADRIDLTASGGGAILDYKTGALPQKNWTATFLTPQLPLEGAILAAGGFEDIPALAVEELLYVKLSGGVKPGELRPLENPAALPASALARLAERIAWFDDPATPYPPRVIPRSLQDEGDYDHLARVREWAPSGWEEET